MGSRNSRPIRWRWRAIISTQVPSTSYNRASHLGHVLIAFFVFAFTFCIAPALRQRRSLLGRGLPGTQRAPNSAKFAIFFFGGPACKAETARNPIERASPSRTPSLHRRLPPPTHAGQGGARGGPREPPHQPRAPPFRFGEPMTAGSSSS
jgi:hypothetical protein